VVSVKKADALHFGSTCCAASASTSAESPNTDSGFGSKPTTWTPLETVIVQHALQLGQQVTAQLGCSDRAISGVALCAQGLLPDILQQPNAPQNALLAQTSST